MLRCYEEHGLLQNESIHGTIVAAEDILDKKQLFAARDYVLTDQETNAGSYRLREENGAWLRPHQSREQLRSKTPKALILFARELPCCLGSVSAS